MFPTLVLLSTFTPTPSSPPVPVQKPQAFNDRIRSLNQRLQRNYGTAERQTAVYEAIGRYLQQQGHPAEVVGPILRQAAESQELLEQLKATPIQKPKE